MIAVFHHLAAYRGRVTTLLAIALVTTLSLPVAAEVQLIRIGTGGSAGTYLPIGSLIAEAISSAAAGSGANGADHSGVLALAQRSKGSVANVREISAGLLEAGLAQADVAHWAYQGTGPFANSAPHLHLRTVATLYLENLHLVARTGSGIGGVADLVGQRVSLDEVGSGTLLDVRPILQEFGLTGADLKPVYLKPADAIARLRRGQLDAFFILAGYPVSVVSQLVQDGVASVVPIAGPAVDRLVRKHSFLTGDAIPVGVYGNESSVPTIAVAAQLIVGAELASDLVYRITSMLWSDRTRQLLVAGHPKGREVRLESALVGMGVPLHPGAARYYQELGLAPGGRQWLPEVILAAHQHRSGYLHLESFPAGPLVEPGRGYVVVVGAPDGER